MAILGLGLIGGSIALDIKKKKLAREVVGYNRSPQGRREALKRKACDNVFSDPQKAVLGADLVILATPVQTIPQLARQIAGSLKKGAIVTDVGSTKLRIVKKLQGCLPKHVVFMGGHPIAGTEKTGMQSAVHHLFEGRWWLFTPTQDSRSVRSALQKLQRLAKELGSKTASLPPQQHDQLLALISHLPHMSAYALMDTALTLDKRQPLKYAAGGFRDYTRIAASSPQMWSEICLDNAGPLLKMIERFEKSLGKIKSLIAKRDAEGLIRFFESASEVRRKL